MQARHDVGRPVLLDLGCGQGGASAGYRTAGFSVIGVDSNPQPRYPFEFIQADMIDILRSVVSGDIPVDAIHASPPCQKWSAMSTCRPGLADTYPDLITPLRFLLRRTGLPYVIENVEGAPLEDPVTLCGSQFGLIADWHGHGRVYLKRHRLFETNFPVPDPGPHDHTATAVTVAGHGRPTGTRYNRRVSRRGETDARADLRGRGYADMTRRLMCIDWMTRDGLNEAVPPPYAAYVGRYAMWALQMRDAA